MGQYPAIRLLCKGVSHELYRCNFVYVYAHLPRFAGWPVLELYLSISSPLSCTIDFSLFSLIRPPCNILRSLHHTTISLCLQANKHSNLKGPMGLFLLLELPRRYLQYILKILKNYYLLKSLVELQPLILLPPSRHQKTATNLLDLLPPTRQ
jgi:hypothetical protein